MPRRQPRVARVAKRSCSESVRTVGPRGSKEAERCSSIASRQNRRIRLRHWLGLSERGSGGRCEQRSAPHRLGRARGARLQTARQGTRLPRLLPRARRRQPFIPTRVRRRRLPRCRLLLRPPVRGRRDLRCARVNVADLFPDGHRRARRFPPPVLKRSDFTGAAGGVANTLYALTKLEASWDLMLSTDCPFCGAQGTWLRANSTGTLNVDCPGGCDADRFVGALIGRMQEQKA